MKPSFLLVCLLAAATIGLRPFPVNAQAASPMNGVWTLNRSLSETPRDIGFNMDWTRTSNAGGQTAGSTGGGRGRRGSSGGGGTRGSAPTFSGRRESSEDARRLQYLPQGDLNRVLEVRIVRGDPLVNLEEGLDVLGPGVAAQRLGAGALNARVRILQRLAQWLDAMTAAGQ